ncbi:MAG: cytochrome c oxidase subunit I [Solirubrobacteraceae bacterium]
MAATDTTVVLKPRPQVVAHSVPRKRLSWIEWVTGTDHKRIGILYLYLTFAFFVIGGVEALLLRVQLGAPDNTFLTPQRYNELFTLHGTTMIFLFIIPVFAGFANYVIPLMIGARDMAFPRVNAWSFWMLLFGGLVLYGSLFFNPPEASWWNFPPLSSVQYSHSGGSDAFIVAIHLIGLSSILGGINFIATIHNMRAPGMGWSRLPLFGWAMLVTSYLVVVASPALTAALLMLLTDRHYGTHFFIPSVPGSGIREGSALLYQHLFWFYSHPAVYIMVLPAFGIVSEVLPVFARKPIFGYKAIAASTVAIAFLGMLVWGHHLFTWPISTIVFAFFMISSMLIAVPTGIKLINWIATLWQGAVEFRVALMFACGLIGTFVIGGISGVMLAMFPVDWVLNDTYFLVAHIHYVLFGGSVFGVFAGLYYWFPKMSGRMLSERLGKASFWTILIGFNVTFLVQHSLGLSGMPRRVYEYPASAGWTGYNLVSTIGSFILSAGIGLTLINVVRSLRHGRVAGPDPWKGNTLEWFTPSPPPANNFDAIPRVRSVEPMQDLRRAIQRDSERVGGEAARETVSA